MIEISAQLRKINGNLVLVPYSEDDQEKAAEYNENQIVRVTVKGFQQTEIPGTTQDVLGLVYHCGRKHR